jgi:hypothetical protein
MDFLAWLQDLGRTANPLAKGFQAKPLYLLLSVLMPVTIGLVVGFGLRAVERILGINPPRGGGH